MGPPNWLRFAKRPFPRNESAEVGLLRAPCRGKLPATLRTRSTRQKRQMAETDERARKKNTGTDPPVELQDRALVRFSAGMEV